jgi:hypothetical protein
MIFPAIIALFFGFLMVSFGLVLALKMGSVLAGLIVGVFGFLGSQRLAHGRKTVPVIIVGAVATLLPVWVIPFFMQEDLQPPAVWPGLVILTLAVLAGVGLTAWTERKKNTGRAR